MLADAKATQSFHTPDTTLQFLIRTKNPVTLKDIELRYQNIIVFPHTTNP